jgi:hypothetical protein
MAYKGLRVAGEGFSMELWERATQNVQAPTWTD